jgi:hypothetical protein
MNRPAIVITMSLPKPAKASVTVSVLVRTNAMTRSIETTSIGIRSRLNRMRAIMSSTRTIVIGVVIQLGNILGQPYPADLVNLVILSTAEVDVDRITGFYRSSSCQSVLPG